MRTRDAGSADSAIRLEASALRGGVRSDDELTVGSALSLVAVAVMAVALLTGCVAAIGKRETAPSDAPEGLGRRATETSEPAPTATASPATALPSDTPSITPFTASSHTQTPKHASPTAPLKEVAPVTLTIVYDNNRHGSGAPSTLRTSWGFACWIETRATTVLFDTGADGPTLLANLKALHLDPRAIDTVVLSHAHGDHTGGLGALLDTGVRPTVYAPESFPRAFKEDVRSRTELVEVGGSKTITQGIRTTGEVGKTIIEQALVVATEEGAVVITGCAHPGIVEMVRRARGQEEGGVALVVGGFHLGGAGEARIQQIARDLRALDVKRVAPCHCTGDEARRIFSEAFGDDCALAGVGWSTSLELELDR